jgi:C4-dicarboxylate-specific signal transduction histidine kinase
LFKAAISNFKQSVLAKRLLIGILLFSSLVTLITTLVVLISDYRQDMSSTEENLKQIKASNLNSLALSIWNYDDGQVYLQLDGILNFPAISYVSLISTHNVLYERGEKKESQWLEEIEMTVFFEEESVAELTMHLDYGALYSRLFNKALIIMASQFIKTLFVSLFILILVQSIITRHLVRMSEYAKHLTLDSLDTALVLERNAVKDELSDVAHSINFMRESLKQDIAKREQAEQQLCDSQKRLRLALDTANLGIMNVNLTDFSCDADERFSEQLGFTRDQFQSLSNPWRWWIEQMSANNRTQIEDCLQQLINGRLSQANIEVEIAPARSEDSTRYFRLLMVLTSPSAISEQYLLCSQWDITEQILKNQHIKMLNQNLETKVKERTQALQDSNQELKSAMNQLEAAVDQLKSTQQQLILNEKMATLGHILFGVAHELNTPLGICMTAISAMEKILSNQEDSNHMSTKSSFDEMSQYAQLISNNLSRAVQIIKAFKELSVDQSEPLEIIRLHNFLQDFLRHIQTEIPPTIKINISGSSDVEISTYPNTLKKVLEALVMNAKTHAFTKDQTGTINLNYVLEETHIVISVIDNGKGIGEAEKQRIFDAFFTTKRNQGGLGLGLNITYNLVHGVLGGMISCENVDSGGAKFVITLPIQHAPKLAITN